MKPRVVSSQNLEYGRLYTVLYCYVLYSTVLYIGIHSHNVFTNPSGLILHKKIRKFAHRQSEIKQTNREHSENSKTEATLIPCGSWVAGQQAEGSGFNEPAPKDSRL